MKQLSLFCSLRKKEFIDDFFLNFQKLKLHDKNYNYYLKHYELYVNNFDNLTENDFINKIIEYYRNYIPSYREYFKYNVITFHYTENRLKELHFQKIFPKSINIIIHYKNFEYRQFKEMFNLLKTSTNNEEFIFRKKLNKNFITFDNYYFDDNEIHFFIDEILFNNNFKYLSQFQEQLSDVLQEKIDIDKDLFIDYININKNLLEQFFNKKFEYLIDYHDLIKSYINNEKEKINNIWCSE